RQNLILYTTETGTARETADHIARECDSVTRSIRVQFHCRVQKSMDHQILAGSIKHLVIFVVSATGWGELRAMISSWNMLLRSDLPDDLFEDVSYSAGRHGLCWPAGTLLRRMQSLRVVKSWGEKDEPHRLGWISLSYPWVEHLLEVLLQHYRSPLPPVDHHPVYASATPDPLSDTIWESFLCFIRLQLRQKLTRPSS
ncbi:hypothetical protein M405DRAFT_724155, partial [Rhizopogon salebrosus TDB-379]